MSLTRRQFLAATAGLAVLAPLPAAMRAAAAATAGTRYLGARADGDGNHYLTCFDAAGSVYFDRPLPGRGHAVAVHPHGAHVVQVARRPGRYLLVLDAAGGEVLHRVESAAGRHYCGHGEFSADGRWLYTTENEYARGRGVIGVYDVAAGYARVGEMPAFGIGPHDLRLLGDGRTLVVANGGILTHPDTGRAKLNLETMSPSLAYIDTRDATLLEEHRLPDQWHRNSIRHLGVTTDDRVCFAMQYEGSRRDRPPLVGLHRRGEAIILCTAPDAIRTRMRNYCGSVVADRSGRWFAVSAPRGNLVTWWAVHGGEFAGHAEIVDGCGLAAGDAAGTFLLSSGQGALRLHRVGAETGRDIPVPGTMQAMWDNHLSRLDPATARTS